MRRNMTKRYIFIPIASFLLNFSILTAQNWTEMSGQVSPHVTRLDGERLTWAPPAANISVNYTGFTPKAQAAFQRAVDIWSSLLIYDGSNRNRSEF